MKKIPSFFFFFVLVSFFYGEPLKVAAVQLELKSEYYSSVENFFREMEKRVAEAVNAFDPDFIIFPEYTSVFMAITPYFSYLKEETDLYEVFVSISKDYGYENLHDLFLFEAANVERNMSFWGNLSKRYDVHILGGSYFAERAGKLTNRLAVYDTTGEIFYVQDKFFLTDFETELLGLESGSPNPPEGIRINDKLIVFTICRDTFLDRWETMYDQADLWIDIKANGEVYGEEQVTLFQKALPARLEDSSARYGATVCLTGSFYDLLWEGISSFVGNMESGVHSFIESRSPRDEEILYFTID